MCVSMVISLAVDKGENYADETVFLNQVFLCAQHLSVCNKHFDRSVLYTAFVVHSGFTLYVSLFLS